MPTVPDRRQTVESTHSAHPVISVGSLTVASCHTLARLADLQANRKRYDAACQMAASLYSPAKTPEWKRACEAAKALSKTIPLTVAKRKLKNGKVVYGDE